MLFILWHLKLKHIGHNFIALPVWKDEANDKKVWFVAFIITIYKMLSLAFSCVKFSI